VVYWSGHATFNGGARGATVFENRRGENGPAFAEAFFKGVLCNLLVCLGVWLCMAGRSVTDKVLAIIFPISAFVAAGFEHSVANMYFISLAIFLRDGSTPRPRESGDPELVWFCVQSGAVTLATSWAAAPWWRWSTISFIAAVYANEVGVNFP